MAFEFDKLTQETFRDEPEIIPEFMEKFPEFLEKSYRERPGPTTRKAQVERLDIMAKWFQTFRRDMRWSRQRAYDHLVEALIAELDGVEYTPTREGRNSWSNKREPLIWTP